MNLLKKRKHINVGLRQIGIVLFAGGVFHGIETGEIVATVVLCLTGPAIYLLGCEE